MAKSNAWAIVMLTLTLVCFLEWKNGFGVGAGPIPVYGDDNDDGVPSLSYSNPEDDLEPQVMDTGVEFLVDFDKNKNGNGVRSSDEMIEPVHNFNDRRKRMMSNYVPQFEQMPPVEKEWESDVDDDNNPIYALRPVQSLLESYESRLPSGRRAILPDRLPFASQLPHTVLQFDRPVKSAYTIEDFQEPRHLIRRNKKSRFNMPTEDTDQRQEYNDDLATNVFAAEGSEAPGPDEQDVATVYSTSARSSRPHLVRQDAFDMADEDVEESELQQIRDSVDRLLKKKKQTKRQHVMSFPVDEEDNTEMDDRQADNDLRVYNYRIQSPINRRTVRQLNEEDFPDADSLFEANEDGPTVVSAIVRNSPSLSDKVRLLRPKSLEEARALVDTGSHTRIPSPMKRPAPVRFFMSDEDDSENEPTSQFGHFQQTRKGEFDQTLNMAPRRMRQLQKRSYQQNNEYDQQEDYDTTDQEAIETRQMYTPQLTFDNEEGYDSSDKRRSMDRLSDLYPSPSLLERRSGRSAPYMQADDYDDSDANQQWLDRGEFDGGDPATTLSAIEEPSKDDEVDPAVAGRFRVCGMVKQNFHKDLFFTGRTLEVDECLVTCERKEGDRVFSHIFKLVDWPCGKKDEGKCQQDGSCSVFL